MFRLFWDWAHRQPLLCNNFLRRIKVVQRILKQISVNNLSYSKASQNATCVRRVWEILEPRKNVNANRLSNADKKDGYWFSLNLPNIKYSKLLLYELSSHLAATTNQSWLHKTKQFFHILDHQKNLRHRV